MGRRHAARVAVTNDGGRRRAGFAVAAVIVAALVTGCSGGSGADSSGVKGDGSSYVTGDGAVTVVPAGKRQQPVELSADTLTGDRLDVAALRGKPVVLNVWGSWCPPCRKEAPDLQAASQELKGKAGFVGINTRDQTAAALAYEKNFKVTYPSLFDRGTLLLSLRGAVSPNQIPSTLVLDSQGRVAARFTGPVTTRSLVQMVEDVSTST